MRSGPEIGADSKKQGLNMGEELRRFLDNLQDFVFVMNLNGQILHVNQVVIDVLGYSYEEIIELEVSALHPLELGEEVCRIMQAIKDDSENRCDLPILNKKGSKIQVETRVSRGKWGGREVLFGISRDISRFKRQEEELRSSEARYRMVVETQTELIARVDFAGSITFANKALCRYLGRSREELRGRNFLEFIYPEDRDKVFQRIRSLTPESPIINNEHRIVLPSGEICWQQWVNQAIFNNEGILLEYQAVGRDITQNKMMQEKLAFLSLHDSLTGLYNRAFFDEEMHRLEGDRYDSVGIIICDVNGLKLVNDMRGHQAGDNLLKTAAGVLQACFRRGDVVARIGGDEFAVLLPHISASMLAVLLERVKKVVEQHPVINGHIPLSLAFGSALKEKGERMESVFARADNNMYAEKEKERFLVRQVLLEALKKEEAIY